MYVLLIVLMHKITYPAMQVGYENYSSAQECKEWKARMKETLKSYDVNYTLQCVKGNL